MSELAVVNSHKQIPYSCSGVYIIIDKDNLPLYIGSSTNLRNRLYQHFKGVSNTKEYCDKISKAILISPMDYGLEKYAIIKFKPKLNGYTFDSWKFNETNNYEQIIQKVDDLWKYEEE